MSCRTIWPLISHCPFFARTHQFDYRVEDAGGSMSHIYSFLLVGALMFGSPAFSQPPQSRPALRVALVGLGHGPGHGFLHQYQHSPEIQIVGVVEPEGAILATAARRYGFQANQIFTDLEDMIEKVHP